MVDRTAQARRALAPALAGLTACAILIALAFAQGGYFPSSYTTAGAVGLAVLGVLSAVRTTGLRPSRTALVGGGALVALAAWTGLSERWSPDPEAARLAAERILLYVALLGLGIHAAGNGRYARAMVWSALAVGTVMVLAGVGSRLFSGIGPQAEDLQFTGYRLAYPLGYWNAMGAVAAMTAVLGTGLAAERRAPVVARAAAAGVAVIAVVTLDLTLSRGGFLSLFAGLIVLAVAGAHRPSLLVVLATIALGSVVAIVRLRGYGALVDDPGSGSGRIADGRAFAPQLAALALATAVAVGALAIGNRSAVAAKLARRLAKPAGIGLAVLAVATFAIAYALRGGSIEGTVADASGRTTAWISDQWHEFLRPGTPTERGTARLTTARTTRSDLFRVAFDGFEDHPLRGDGAGGFTVRWFQERRVNETVRNAHSVWLETLGELGIVGGLLLAVFVASLFAGSVRARLRPGGLSRTQAASVTALLTTWLVSSTFDWNWQMPAVTGLALFAGAAAYPVGKVRRSREVTV